MKRDALKQAIRSFVGGNTDLLKNPDRLYPLSHSLAGHCYVASEAYFHLTGGYDEWQVERVTVEVPEPLGGTAEFTHWYLRDRETGQITDLTAEQFTEYERGSVEIPYDEGTATGFMTSEPSERAQEVISAIPDRWTEDAAAARIADCESQNC